MVPNLRTLVLVIVGTAGVSWATTGGPSGPIIEGPSASEPADAPAPPAPRRFHCRTFTTALERAVDTRDRSSELGRWVIDHEGRGWEVASLDFEVGQKPTGFAEGYVQVCLTPVLAP